MSLPMSADDVPIDFSRNPGLAADLRAHAKRWPDEAGAAEQFLALLADPLDPFERSRLAGHFTASAWLVDRSGTRVLLTHHRKLGRWLQLGGHADGDRDLARVALKEAEEESGLSGLSIKPGPFDLDCHWIPERGDVPGHWHFDVRYVATAGDDEDFVVSRESLDLAWCGIRDLVDDENADPSLRRMARKWVQR